MLSAPRTSEVSKCSMEIHQMNENRTQPRERWQYPRTSVETLNERLQLVDLETIGTILG